MRIALLVPEMEMGGVEQGTADLAIGFRRRGHSVWILCAGGRMLPPLQGEGVRWVPVPFHLKSPFAIAYSTMKVRLFCARVRPHILHARSRVPAWAAYLASRGFPDIHFITGFHSFYNRHWPSRILGKGERVIAISNAVAREAVAHFGAGRRVRVVYNGVFIGKIQRVPDERQVRLGVLGRLTEGKGFDKFLAIFGSLCAQGVPVRATIGIGTSGSVGERSKLDRYAQAIRAAGLADRVTLLLNPSRESFFSQVDVYVAPVTVPEGFGRTIVEAQRCGIPVVATDIGAFPEIVRNNETGFLVKPAVADFVCALLKLVNDPSVRSAMGEQARAWISARFTVDRMVEETLAVYREVAGEAR